MRRKINTIAIMLAFASFYAARDAEACPPQAIVAAPVYAAPVVQFQAAPYVDYVAQQQFLVNNLQSYRPTLNLQRQVVVRQKQVQAVHAPQRLKLNVFQQQQQRQRFFQKTVIRSR